MTTKSNYLLQNFGMNNAKVLTGNSQPVPDFRGHNLPLTYVYRVNLSFDIWGSIMATSIIPPPHGSNSPVVPHIWQPVG